MDPIDQQIDKARAVISPLIERPKLTEKLLKRPPLRFIQDVIISLNRVSHFVNDVLDKEDLTSGSLDTREKRLRFLHKIIEYAQNVSGNELLLQVKPGKILAGLEVGKTIELLIVLGTAASTAILLIKEQRANRSVSSREKRIILKGTTPLGNKGRPAATLKYQESQKSDPKAEESNNAANRFNIDGEPETTIKMLHGLVTGFTVSYQQLKRPSLHFLYQVVIELAIASRAFTKFTAAECFLRKPSTEREAQQTIWLQNLVSFAQNHFDLLSQDDAQKIIAMLDPQATNKLLQILALVAQSDSKLLDHSENAFFPQTKICTRHMQSSQVEHGTQKTQSMNREVILSHNKGEMRKPEIEQPIPKQGTIDSATQIARPGPPKRNSLHESLEKCEIVRIYPDDNSSQNNYSADLSREHSQVLNQISRWTESTTEELYKHVFQEKLQTFDGKFSSDAKSAIVSNHTEKNGSTGKYLDDSILSDSLQEIHRTADSYAACLQYLHDNVELMHREKDKWNEEFWHNRDRLNIEQLKTKKSLLLLKKKRLDVEERVGREKAKISVFVADITRNEERIAELIDSVV